MLQDAPRRPSRARGLLPELLPLWVHPTTHHTPHHTTHRTAPHRTTHRTTRRTAPHRTAPHRTVTVPHRTACTHTRTTYPAPLRVQVHLDAAHAHLYRQHRRMLVARCVPQATGALPRACTQRVRHADVPPGQGRLHGLPHRLSPDLRWTADRAGAHPHAPTHSPDLRWTADRAGAHPHAPTHSPMPHPTPPSPHTHPPAAHAVW